MVYQWTHGENGIKMASDMRLSQFDLIGFPFGNGTLTDTGGWYPAICNKDAFPIHYLEILIYAFFRGNI